MTDEQFVEIFRQIVTIKAGIFMISLMLALPFGYWLTSIFDRKDR